MSVGMFCHSGEEQKLCENGFSRLKFLVLRISSCVIGQVT